MGMIPLFIFTLFSVQPLQTSTTSGPCSPIAPNNSGSITINCAGISKQQGEEMLRILNKILTERLDTKTVLAKLDEVLQIVEQSSRRAQAPAGQAAMFVSLVLVEHVEAMHRTNFTLMSENTGTLSTTVTVKASLFVDGAPHFH